MKLNTILIASVIAISSPPVVYAQTNSRADAESSFKLEREMDDKKDELRQQRNMMRTYKTTSDLVQAALVKIDTVKYPDAASQLRNKLQKDVDFATTIDQAKAVLKLLGDLRAEIRRAKEPLQSLIDPEDTSLSPEERKLLRPLRGIAKSGSNLGTTRLFTRQLRTFGFLLDTGDDITELFPDAPKKIAIGKVAIADVLRETSSETFQTDVAKVRQPYADLQKQFSRESTEVQRIIDALAGDLDKLGARVEKLREQSSRIDQTLITFALPGLAIVMIALLAVPRVYGSQDLYMEVFKSGLLLELFTVFFITASILILGLSSKIDSPILGTLLGAISGYVLGRATQKSKAHTQDAGNDS